MKIIPAIAAVFLIGALSNPARAQINSSGIVPPLTKAKEVIPVTLAARDTITAAGITNRIVLYPSGLTVAKVMLLHADSSPVDSTNTIHPGETIFCRLIVSGWKDDAGAVKPGASEMIMNADGNVVANMSDLFSQIPTVTKMAAGVINIPVNLPDAAKDYHDFRVSFRVWDKSSEAEVAGAYKFHVR